jgi:hypothetical protein
MAVDASLPERILQSHIYWSDNRRVDTIIGPFRRLDLTNLSHLSLANSTRTGERPTNSTTCNAMIYRGLSDFETTEMRLLRSIYRTAATQGKRRIQQIVTYLPPCHSWFERWNSDPRPIRRPLVEHAMPLRTSETVPAFSRH